MLGSVGVGGTVGVPGVSVTTRVVGVVCLALGKPIFLIIPQGDQRAVARFGGVDRAKAAKADLPHDPVIADARAGIVQMQGKTQVALTVLALRRPIRILGLTALATLLVIANQHCTLGW